MVQDLQVNEPKDPRAKVRPFQKNREFAEDRTNRCLHDVSYGARVIQCTAHERLHNPLKRAQVPHERGRLSCDLSQLNGFPNSRG
jgi:hypothetical protein